MGHHYDSRCLHPDLADREYKDSICYGLCLSNYYWQWEVDVVLLRRHTLLVPKTVSGFIEALGCLYEFNQSCITYSIMCSSFPNLLSMVGFLGFLNLFWWRQIAYLDLQLLFIQWEWLRVLRTFLRTYSSDSTDQTSCQ